MKSYPLYPEENEIVFMTLFGVGVFLILLAAFLVSYFQSPKEARSFELQPIIKQKLVGFMIMLSTFYMGSTYFFMETMFVNKKRVISFRSVKLFLEKLYKKKLTL